MNWYKKAAENIEQDKQELEILVSSLKSQYPGLDLWVYIAYSGYVELAQIIVPENQRSQGIGTAVIQKLQEFAKSKNKKIVIRPQPDKGKKGALDRFYKNLGFVHNKGRNKDYELSSPFSSTMYWGQK